MTIYKVSNINGRFDHLAGMAAVVAYLRKVEHDETMTVRDAVRDYGWTVKRCTKAQARAVGFDA